MENFIKKENMTQNTELTNYLTLNKFQHTSTMIKYIKGNVIKKNTL